MRISSLLTLTEAATGYSGGTYTDELPHLTLTEAAGLFPAAILEAQMGFNENKIKTINAMTEAAGNAIQLGTPIDMGAIVEASFEGLKQKVKAFFEKIFKWLKSIIAKITLQIDKIRMSGHQLYTKYKNDSRYRGKNYKDLVVNGYKFEHGSDVFTAMDGWIDKIEDLVKAAMPNNYKMNPGEFANSLKGHSYEHDSDQEKADNKAVEELQDVSHEDRVLAYAEQLAGSKFSLTAGNWVADIKKELWGDKVDLKYGTDFSESTISGLLEKPLALGKLKDSYVKLDRAAHKHHDSLQKQLTENERQITKNRNDTSKGTDAEKKAADNTNNALSVVSAYYTEYMKFVSDTYAVINQLKSLHVQYETDRVNQAKMIFGRMLSYNDKKNNNDASFGDSTDGEVEIFDFAL